MPKRSERDLYSNVFEGNPFEDLDAVEIYNNIRWGNIPDEIYEINSDESLATIGDLAKIDTTITSLLYKEKDAPYLAVGKESNFLYIIPKDKTSVVPKFNPSSPDWEEYGDVKETHYYSDKGGDNAYYYHKHELPFPSLWVHKSGIGILIPAYNDGKPSYAVAKEGIIG